MKMTAALCASVFATALCAQNALDLTTPERFTAPSGDTLLYRLHLPKDIPPGRKLPLVIFFHGAGERGTNNLSQLVHGVLPLIQFGLTHNDPAIVIAPQCPPNMQWVDVPWDAPSHTLPAEPSPSMRLALALLHETISKFPVDPARIYVTGISMGGYGTWDAIQRQPDLFAAAMPVCGGGDTACAPAIKKIPVWIFHGDKDGAVPVIRSRNMFKALQDCGGNVQYREYPGAGHNVWTPTYNDADVLAWFFSQKKMLVQ